MFKLEFKHYYSQAEKMESEKRGIFSNHEKKIFPEWIMCRRGGMRMVWNVNGVGKSLLR